MLNRLAFAALTLIALPAFAAEESPSAQAVVASDTAAQNKYVQTNFVANKKSYHPTLAVEKGMIDAWGIANRPKGAGGHFWVVGGNTSYEYVGDVSASPDEKLRPLHFDKLKYVTFEIGKPGDNHGTGVVFSNSTKDFVITQKIEGAADITAPAKFLFASDGGFISAWTERKKEDGSFDRAPAANTVIDESKDGAQFFGIALSSDYSRLYAADFGTHPAIKVYGGDFKPVDVTFDMPFDDNKNGVVDAHEYAPFNVAVLKTPEGDNHVFVAYAKIKECEAEAIKKGDCKKGELMPGEEDTDQPGNGRVAEFTESGKLVRVWEDNGSLSAPWGMVYAPENFGALSGKLLVANFGDGRIAAFDPSTHKFVAYLNNAKGKELKIEKIWGLMFGNGESLGDSDALYFTAGPRDEKDGLFGSLRLAARR